MGRIGQYFDIKRDVTGNEYMEVSLDGLALLRMPMINKGTAFTAEERVALRLDGLLPPMINSLDLQVDRVYRRFHATADDLAKYQYLRALQERQEVLFYALLERHLPEILPIIYTPTVGDAVRRFSELFEKPRGLTLSTANVDRARACIDNFPWNDVRMIVATDSSAILGIGDQGYGGLAICIGKLALYTCAGGVAPYHTMPTSLDVGTDRAELFADPLYLGVRHGRLKGETYFEFLDKFVEAVKGRWPRAVLQWEDLSKETAFAVLDRYRKALPSFNDDIQGTGAVTLAGALNACRLKGERFRDQRVVVHGAGAGGIGVAWALREGLVRDGLSMEEAKRRVFVLDSKGLLTEDRPMEGYKRSFAQPRERLAGWACKGELPSLVETITHGKATMIFGLSGQHGMFDEPVVRAVAANTERPVIFALSNPTASCEAVPADVLAWTEGRAIVATGSPFEPVTLAGKTYPIGQGNNAFVFPGLGQGAILSGAREVTDGMILAASYALERYVEERHPERIYPPVEEMREASVVVAAEVLRQAVADGVADAPELPKKDVEEYVRARVWRPRYLPVVRAK